MTIRIWDICLCKTTSKIKVSVFFQLGKKCPYIQQIFGRNLSGKASTCQIKPKFNHINERLNIPCFFQIPNAVSDPKLCRFEVRSPKGWKYTTCGMIEIFHMI